MKLLPIPWMKLKLENIYDMNLYGNLFLIYNDKNNTIYNTEANYLNNLLYDYNILVDDYNPLYIYLPFELNDQLYKLINSFKSLYKDNVYIVLGGYKENYYGLSQLDCLSNLCTIYHNLDSLITYSYLINSDKTYEIFTSLSDTQKVCINPLSSCTISGITLNYHSKHINPNNANHLSFVNLMEDNCNEYFIDCYLKGLTNNNNNFNFNF